MRHLLSPILGKVNPAAYRAHFARLDPEGRREYLAPMTAQELAFHLSVLGEPAVVGLQLSLSPPSLLATVSGKAFAPAAGDAATLELTWAVEAVVAELGRATVTGLIEAPADALAMSAPLLTSLGWQVRAVTVFHDRWADTGEPVAQWSVSGDLPRLAGTFWSARRLLEQSEVAGTVGALREAARALGASFEER